jgi:dGTPase
MAVSYTITNHLGLNTELATTIALGHDLGHAPFGHQGESVISGIAQNELGERFWHEKNSLWFVDNLETLEDPQRKHRNLNLTYAVRDGIICHCGEVSETSIKPRVDPIDLNGIQQASEYSPFTWEGCVVKIADKISFLGRDIEDALTLKLLRASDLKALKEIVGRAGISVAKGSSVRDVNNTILMHDFIVDLCESSNPEDGLRFSEQHLNLMNLLRRFSAEYIYMNPRLSYFKSYARLVIETIFNYLKGIYKQRDTWKKLSYETKYCPVLTSTFEDWLLKYSDIDLPARERRNYKNRVVYDISDAKSYAKAVLDFISGMTDSFAIRMFEELIGF